METRQSGEQRREIAPKTHVYYSIITTNRAIDELASCPHFSLVSNHIAGQYAAGEICRIFPSRARGLCANAGILPFVRPPCLQVEETNLTVRRCRATMLFSSSNISHAVAARDQDEEEESMGLSLRSRGSDGKKWAVGSGLLGFDPKSKS
ncbi:hypothetical protein B296_00013441 [Ensete ventricosum]|uniref:Uncharacterized protein n=1 Tax=Ensete ventricosum TaxID=4639 RepID=A0A427B2J3_ENSVE|nr:hypothetical protein B296_00013441 [Ensete ventricosum]